ncbi:putative transporter YutK [Amblyomma americanum]
MHSVVANTRVSTTLQDVWRKLKYASLLVLLHAYLLMAIRTQGWGETQCSGAMFITASVLFVDAVLLHMLCIEKNLFDRIVDRTKSLKIRSDRLKNLQMIFWTLVVTVVGTYVLLESRSSTARLTALGGVGLCILLGYVCSKNRREIPWPSVLAAVMAQFLCGLLVVRWAPGVFECLSVRAEGAINSTFHASGFIFGYLEDGRYVGLPRQPPIFAFHNLPVVLFFSFLMAVLHYWGAVQFLAVNVGNLLQMITRISAPECICSAATIIVGLPMAVEFIKPFMGEMTRSELHCIMAAGFCGVPAAIFAMLLNMGNYGNHLLAANLMTIPAGLGMAKLLLPETEKAPLGGANIKPLVSSENTVFEAGSNGAISALPVVAHITVTLIVYAALMAMVDAVVGSMLLAIGFTVRLQELLGTLFSPLSFAFGLSGTDAVHVGYLVAVRTLATEILAFLELEKLHSAGAISERAAVVATYALCSASSLEQMPVVANVLTNIAPPRRAADIQGVRWRALFTGCLSTCLNACIAGCLVKD